jgi:hypothetical protein
MIAKALEPGPPGFFTTVGAAVKVRLAAPLLLTVIVACFTVLVAGVDVIAGVGAEMPTIAAAVPVPLSVTGEPVTVALEVIVSVALINPTAVGENTTVIVQDPAIGVNVVPQVPPARENRGDENASAIPVTSTVPVLLRVRVRAALVPPCGTLPKFSGPPVTLAARITLLPNSTAPIS